MVNFKLGEEIRKDGIFSMSRVRDFIYCELKKGTPFGQSLHPPGTRFP